MHLLLPVAVLVAQVLLPAPPRDTRAPDTGTATLKGRVVDADTGTPVARAQVRLSFPGGSRDALTDQAGAFTFTTLPAGSYSISAAKVTYMAARHPDPGKSIRASRQPSRLAAGETADVTIRLYKGGVLSGRVLDQHGDPIEGAQVRAIRLQGGRARPGDGGPMTSTNDIGEFRLPRTPPGAYVLHAAPSRRSLPPGGMAGGEVEPVPTFYPGVASLQQAVPLTVERGHSPPAVDIVLMDGQTGVVTGTVYGPDGAPLSASGFVSARSVETDQIGQWHAGGGGIDPQGRFTLKLPPGEYDLDAQFQRPLAAGQTGRPDEYHGTIRVSVTGGDAQDVAIRTTPPGSISGRIIFEGSRPLPQVQGRVNVHLQSRDGRECRGGGSTVRADGTFTIEGARGVCTVMVSAGGGWFVKSVTYRGADATARPIAVTAGRQIRGVEVVLTDQERRLYLDVTDEEGRPTQDFVALVFPADPERWTARDYVGTRLHVPPPPAPPGTAISPGAPAARQWISSLPPGDYYAVAVEDLEADSYMTPDVLERLSRVAQRVTITQSSETRVALRLATRW